MPKQKDLKRIVRSRMQKTGESYTAARIHIVKPKADYGALAGMSDESVKKATGRDWAAWVTTLDAFDGTKKPHRDLAVYVSSLGTPDWWSQTVVVGYERIRGLRAIGQRRGGSFEASKSRTFPIPIAKLYEAFANARRRARWLPGVKLEVRTAIEPRSMRISMADGTLVLLAFIAKGDAKSTVTVTHTKLASKQAADSMKVFWSERLDALSETLGAK